MSVGIILGAGIYVLIGEAAGLAGNGLWLSFIIAASVASLTGLSYAELSSRFPHAGAEYIYVKESFGEKIAWIIGWLIIAGSIIGATTVAIGFGKYFSALFDIPVMIVSFFVLLIIGVILVVGVKETAAFTILFTLIEATGLIIIIFIGIPYFGSVDYTELAAGMKGVIEAGVLIFFGYIGFESITRLADETKNPEKNIPKAIIFSIVITTIMYILVGLSAVSIIDWGTLATAEAPLALVAENVFGQNSFIILSGIALFSTFNTVLVMLLSGSRIIYGIANENALPKIFLKVLKRNKTPIIAIFFVVLFSMFFLLIDDLQLIANLTNFTIFATFLGVNASVIYLRHKKPTDIGFKIPLSIGKTPVIPVIGLITTIFMIANLSYTVLFYGIILIIIGVIIDLILDKKLNLN